MEYLPRRSISESISREKAISKAVGRPAEMHGGAPNGPDHLIFEFKTRGEVNRAMKSLSSLRRLRITVRLMDGTPSWEAKPLLRVGDWR